MAVTPFNLLSTSIDVSRKSATVDAGGSPVTTYAAHLSSVPARVQPMSGSEAVRYGRESTRRMFRVFVAGNVDILETDRITWDSRTLDVQEVTDLQGAQVVKRIIAEQTL